MAKSVDNVGEMEVELQESICDWIPQLVEGVISALVAFCRRVTLLNAVIFLLKYIPTSIYVYRLIKETYVKTRDKMSRNRAAFEEIQSRIVQMNKKIGVRNSEIVARSAEVKRAAERLRKVRTQVREVIESDERLKTLRDRTTNPDENIDKAGAKSQENDEGKDFICGLMKEFNCKRMKEEPCDIGGGEPPNQVSPETSVYCSVSGADEANKECTIKLVKVTNVYKVAYLRNIVKQKQLLRANKKALLEEKMSSIKKLLDDWQKTLDSVTKEKIIQADQESQDEVCEISGSNSDSDVKNEEGELDDHEMNWHEEPPMYRYDGYDRISKEYYESDVYRMPNGVNSDCRNRLFILPEETISQMEIDLDMKQESEGSEHRADL